VQRNVAEKKFLQAIGGWKKIRAQKNCPTNGPSEIWHSVARPQGVCTVIWKQPQFIEPPTLIGLIDVTFHLFQRE
jgi:hypothetical protein